MTLPKAVSQICVTVGIIVLTTVTTPTALGDISASQIETQRELFQDVYKTVERGD